MKEKISRRELLKMGIIGTVGVLGATAFRPYFGEFEHFDSGDHLVRVAVNQVSVYSEPSEKSEILFQVYRNDLLRVYYEVISEDGPKWNPVWYRVFGGYIHRAHLQTVKMQLNTPLGSLPENGRVFEVTVPYTRSWFRTHRGDWLENYILYYSSTHWVVDIDTGPDGEPAYVIENDLLKLPFHVPAIHMRAIPFEDMTPLSPDTPPEKKRIEISIVHQTLTCFEYDEIVLDAKVSTGLLRKTRPGAIPMATPKGYHRLFSKMPCKHMGQGIITDDVEEYVLPGVPWTNFVVEEIGVAIHGTYWHHNYGTPMSHGCINEPLDRAAELYNWSNIGDPVLVHY